MVMRQATRSYPTRSGGEQGTDLSHPQPTRGPEDAQRISLLDAFGDQREGFVLRVDRWDESVAADLDRLDGHFSIVILSEPPQGSPHWSQSWSWRQRCWTG